MLSNLQSPLTFALALGPALLTGCGSGDDSQTAESGLPKEIVIGVAIAKSGYLVPCDANIAAVEQLVKETNARGGIDRAKIRVVSVDNHSEPQQQPVAAPEAIEDGADALLSVS
jgi:ABC-type branched-subunit amino acid transport system substrate-binding protein